MATTTTTPAFVVGKVTVPTDEEQAALERVMSEHGEIRAIFLFDNRRTSSEGPVEGGAYEFAPGARIRQGSPLLAAADRLFGHVLVARILESDEAIDESLLKRRLSTLADKIPVTSPMPYSLSQNTASPKPRDVATWEAQLGGHGHFVGM